MSEAKPLAPAELARLAETFRLLGDPSRLRILLHCAGAAKPVNAIAEDLGLSQSLVSHHLKLLRDARLVIGKRQAKQVFYEIADKHVSDMLFDMIEHIEEETGAAR